VGQGQEERHSDAHLVLHHGNVQVLHGLCVAASAVQGGAQGLQVVPIVRITLDCLLGEIDQELSVGHGVREQHSQPCGNIGRVGIRRLAESLKGVTKSVTVLFHFISI